MTAEIYIEHVKKCLDMANNNTSKLSHDILYNLQGMTGHKTRHFYNNLCSLDDARYLEIGTWKGSSAISALYMNMHCKATLIDNWSEFDGTSDELIANIKKHIPYYPQYVYINDDCFNLKEPLIGSYNIYMYDGNHDEISQKKAITDFYKYLDDVSIVVIDDWNIDRVRDGTFKGLDEIDGRVLFKEEIRLTYDGSHTEMAKAHTDFWNGMAVFVIEKNKTA